MRSTEVLDLEQRIKDKRDLSLRIKIYCLVDIVLCLIFWIWALYHIFAKSEPDAGSVTFLFTIISCIFGLISVYYYHKERDDRARYFGIFHCVTIVISHLLLCANFTAGAIIEENEFWVDCYFILMAMGYALSAISFGRWSYKWYNLFSKQSDYGALMNDMDGDIEKL